MTYGPPVVFLPRGRPATVGAAHTGPFPAQSRVEEGGSGVANPEFGVGWVEFE